MFIDEAEILTRGGDGGRGCVAFRRESYVPRGGPAGGDGGNGGSVRLVADPQLTTLFDIAQQPVYAAENGEPGRGKDQHGRSGRDLEVRVPPGTVVRDVSTGVVLRDLTQPGESVLVAGGGRGGRGNKAFASPTNRTPREYEEGEPGEERRLALELKLIADVGIVGMPNAGKSTLLSRLSDARPRIADYPFTTLAPQLGVVDLGDFRRLVMADLPGLIEGAHRGVGLGDEFLRHIERTRVICHLIDILPLDGSDPADNYRVIRREMETYSPELGRKPEVVVANKMDLSGAEANADALERALGRPVTRISAVTGRGLADLLRALVGVIGSCVCA
jgi:GTP-binding protein